MEYDEEKIKKTIVIGIIIILIIAGLFMLYNYRAKAPIKEICENNPTERYKEPCKNYNECVNTCMNRLIKNTGEQ